MHTGISPSTQGIKTYSLAHRATASTATVKGVCPCAAQLVHYITTLDIAIYIRAGL